MRRQPLRLTFDLSALHGEYLDRLAGSRLLQLCGRRYFAIALTPVFLDELVSGYGVRNRDVPWQPNLRFAISVCNDGVFLDKLEIWWDELVVGRGVYARCKFPKRATRRLVSADQIATKLAAMAEGNDVAEYWESSQELRSENRRRREGARKTARQLREGISARLRDVKLGGALRGYPFHSFRSATMLKTGSDLMDLVSETRADELRGRWTLNPLRFPFFTSFVEGFLFGGYYALVRQNDPIDINAQADYEQLCYMNWLDVIVSNDQGFFRSAFNELWRPRGKLMWSTDELLTYVETIA